MALRKCPVQSVCIHYESGGNKPPNHDVRDKVICKTFLSGCDKELFVETEIMGLIVACDLRKK